jgi:hypothetical protein
MKIQVNIERLILDGIDIPPGQRPLLQTAVEVELGRLLIAGGLSPALSSSGATASIRVNAMQLLRGNNPTQLGQQIARSVYGGIGKAQEIRR